MTPVVVVYVQTDFAHDEETLREYRRRVRPRRPPARWRVVVHRWRRR